VTGRREDRNRIPRALVGFSNALLVTGDQKYVDAWRAMIDAVNSQMGAGSIRPCTGPTVGTAGATPHGMLARWKSGTGRKNRRTSLAPATQAARPRLDSVAGSGFFRGTTRRGQSKSWNAT
jgi:hypothetical protein